MRNRDGFWQRPSNNVVLILCLLALGLSMAALFRPSTVGTVSAQQSAPTTGSQRMVAGTLQDAFVNIADAVEPSVVSIEAVTKAPSNAAPDSPDNGDDQNGGGIFSLPNPFDMFRGTPQPSQPQPRVGTSTGSGVVIRVDGGTSYVLTNFHVVDGATTVRVVLPGSDGNKVDAKIVGTDEKTDLAVISMSTPRGISAASLPRLGDSGHVKVGQWAIAIGNPLDVGETLTVGVVSATGREVSGVEGFKDYRDMIQTDASINPGNSGGPLVNINGEVIGINTAIASPSRGSIGIGFAIPINVAKTIIDQLISKGSVTRGYLGVATSGRNRKLSGDLKSYYGAEYGALVETVNPDTPAARAGIKPEDVIVSWDGQKIADFDDLEAAVSTTPPGRQIPVVVLRNKERTTLTVTTAKRPSENALNGPGGNDNNGDSDQPGKESKLTKLGLSVTGVTPELSKGLGLPNSAKGVLVTKVDFGGPAEEAGVPVHSVIMRVGRTPTPTVAAFKNAISALKPGDSAILLLSVQTTATGSNWTNTIVTVKPDNG